MVQNYGFGSNGLMNHEEDMEEVEVEAVDILGKYGRRLVTLARENEIPDIIGRDVEVRTMVEILLRKTKNNPIILGEAGVGKTALIEGFAHLIARDEVPDLLKNSEIFELDVASMLAGCKYKGDFEERFKEITDAIKETENLTILFVDEIHTFLNAGKSEGSVDAGNLLKPMLARGEITCIGATTNNEYKQSFGKDEAMARRFQKIVLEEPSKRETLTILRQLKPSLEEHYSLEISDEALYQAVEMSDRYIKTGRLPDKAIDTIDEACSMVKTATDNDSHEVYLKRRKANRLQLELTNIERDIDKDEEAREVYDEIESEYNTLTEELQLVNGVSQEISEIKSQIVVKSSEIDAKKSLKDSTSDVSAKASLQHLVIPRLVEELAVLENRLAEIQSENESVLYDVSKNEIEKIISRKSGVPVAKMNESEKEKLLVLDETLAKRVIGQEEAVELVTNTVLRSKVGIQDENRPLGSFIFAGLTGVGKTELAKALAEQLFDSENKLIRVDMSEYMEKHSASKLIGSPPGYVGFESGGQLTEQVKKHPYSVILFDEVEKAHPDVTNVLLQILDDGHATDSQGGKVDFKNTIIILTTNLGATQLTKENIENDYEGTKEKVIDIMKTHFRPEFINRIDETIMFKPLGDEQFVGIANKFLLQMVNRLAKKKINIDFSDNVAEWVVENGSDALMGARPIKRYIQSKLESPISKTILQHDITKDSKIVVDIREGNLNIDIEL